MHPTLGGAPSIHTSCSMHMQCSDGWGLSLPFTQSEHQLSPVFFSTSPQNIRNILPLSFLLPMACKSSSKLLVVTCSIMFFGTDRVPYLDEYRVTIFRTSASIKTTRATVCKLVLSSWAAVIGCTLLTGSLYPARQRCHNSSMSSVLLWAMAQLARPV